MTVIRPIDLDYDVLDGEYINIPAEIHLKTGRIIKKPIDGYTHDEDPFCNYIEVGKEDIPFGEIEKVILLKQA